MQQRFRSLHGLGWARAHEGDHLGALRTFHHAADLAPILPQKVMAWVDHAKLGRAMGAGLVATESALYAADLADSVAWETVDDMERIVLLFVAESTASFDPVRSRRLLRRYEATRRAEDATATGIVGSDNIRWRCFEMRAEAMVLRAEGFGARAATLLGQEHEAWLASALRFALRSRSVICKRSPRRLDLGSSPPGSNRGPIPKPSRSRRHVAVVEIAIAANNCDVGIVMARTLVIGGLITRKPAATALQLAPLNVPRARIELATPGFSELPEPVPRLSIGVRDRPRRP